MERIINEENNWDYNLEGDSVVQRFSKPCM